MAHEISCDSKTVELDSGETYDLDDCADKICAPGDNTVRLTGVVESGTHVHVSAEGADVVVEGTTATPLVDGPIPVPNGTVASFLLGGDRQWRREADPISDVPRTEYRSLDSTQTTDSTTFVPLLALASTTKPGANFFMVFATFSAACTTGAPTNGFFRLQVTDPLGAITTYETVGVGLPAGSLFGGGSLAQQVQIGPPGGYIFTLTWHTSSGAEAQIDPSIGGHADLAIFQTRN